MKRLNVLLLLAMTLVLPACETTPPPSTTNKPAEGATKSGPVVLIETSMGNIKVELFEEEAPITVKNFLTYVEDKFYDGTVFHRVIPGFMIQGGGFEPGVEKATNQEEFSDKEKKARDPIKNEASNGLSNKRKTIAMARTPIPDSASAQWFINVGDNGQSLDFNPDRVPVEGAGYAVFGHVIDGMDVVDKIVKVKTKTIIPRVIENVPVEPVIIKSIRRVEK